MIAALVGAALVGLSLGLLGSGGAILTVPVLVYLVGHGEKAAITESLAIVGAISLAGACVAAARKRIDWHSVLVFGPAGMLGAYGGALASKWVPGAVQLLLLSGLMLAAAGLMFRRPPAAERPKRPHPAALAVNGLLVGVATGLVGVGGGFLIVPALVLLVGLPMPIAVGTSLSIIVLNSTTGFLKSFSVLREAGLAVDWPTVGAFAALGVGGMLVGTFLGSRLSQTHLRRAFAVFLVAMAGYIAWRQIPTILGKAREPATGYAPPTAATSLHAPRGVLTSEGPQS